MDESLKRFILYTAPSGEVRVDVLLQEESVWLTQKAIAELFGVVKSTISEHLSNIYATQELDEFSTVRKIRTVQIEGTREVTRALDYYNLDAIISVGYRVNSTKATQFRMWATNTLKEYIIKGFVLDDDKLKQGQPIFVKDYFKMGRIATTVDEQIKLLTDRGLLLDCGEEKAKEYLLDMGYYRLGFYWNPFEIDGNHNFKQGTNFSTVINLYYLDVDLRYLLMRALNRIEINIRTQLIYIVSNHYKNSPTWFSDSRVMSQKFINDFPKFYNPKFIDSNKPIKEHHIKYINDIYAPAWKTLEFLTFGSIYSIFYNLKDNNLKRKIIQHYGIKKVDVFTNYIRTIIFIRNICAHSGLLYDANTPLAVKPTPLIKINNRHSLNTAIQVIIYFLGRISTNRKIDLEKKHSRIIFAKQTKSGYQKNN